MIGKVCSKCKQEKDVSLFSKCSIKKDGLYPSCKQCQGEHSKKYRARPEVKKENKIREKEYLRIRKEIVLKYLLEHPCVDCGNSDVRVLEFDHNGDKREIISRMITNKVNIKILEDEMSKCSVRCANCHRIRHATERNYYRHSQVA